MPGPGSFLVGEEEIKEIMEVLESGHLYRYGDAEDPKFRQKVITLEREFAEVIGVRHGLAVNSGTCSLWSAMKSLGIGEGDEVIVPAYTFTATYTAVLNVGAVPILAEVDDTLNLDPNDIEHRITDKTKAIIPVHMLGNPAELDAIIPIAKKHKLHLIEDGCQAGGARYKGKAVGSYGVFGCFSLNYFKTFTAGDGGLLVTDDDDLYETAFGYHDQGHRPMRTGCEVGRRTIIGMNFRMNELTGAVALAQLRKLPGFLGTLREKKRKLMEMLQGLDGVSFRRITDAQGECATLLVFFMEDAKKARAVADKLGTKPLHESGWHVYANMEHVLTRLRELGQDIRPGSMPRTDDYLQRAINLSVGVVDGGLGSGFGINIKSSDAEIEAVGKQVREAVLAV